MMADLAASRVPSSGEERIEYWHHRYLYYLEQLVHRFRSSRNPEISRFLARQAGAMARDDLNAKLGRFGTLAQDEAFLFDQSVEAEFAAAPELRRGSAHE